MTTPAAASAVITMMTGEYCCRWRPGGPPGSGASRARCHWSPCRERLPSTTRSLLPPDDIAGITPPARTTRCLNSGDTARRASLRTGGRFLTPLRRSLGRGVIGNTGEQRRPKRRRGGGPMSDVVFEQAVSTPVRGHRPSALDLAVTDGDCLCCVGRPSRASPPSYACWPASCSRRTARSWFWRQGHRYWRPTRGQLGVPELRALPQPDSPPEHGLPLAKAGVAKRTVTDRVAQAAAHLELADMLGRRAAALSAGQRIRVALARGPFPRTCRHVDGRPPGKPPA